MLYKRKSSSSYLFLTTFLLVLSLYCMTSCYSFRGINIDPNINTFSVEQFTTSTASPATLPIDFSEKLRDKIRSESRLSSTIENPDITFGGTIAEYRVTSVAPEPGQTTSFSRLTIAIKVVYVNNQDEDNTWTKTFSFFDNFDANQNLIDIEEQLIDNITDQIVNDIFNYAFTNW